MRACAILPVATPPPSGIGEARVSAIDVRDIAAVAAAVLTQTGHVGQTYTLTGPAAVTHGEIARAIASAIGHDVKFIDIPPTGFAFALRKIGMPPWQVDGLIEDYAHYMRGEAAEVYPAIREITRAEPRDVTTFAHDYAFAFGARTPAS